MQMDINIKKISGPVTYYYFNVFGRKLHIFGDKHVKEALCENCEYDCIYISDLIEYVSNREISEGKQIDIFLEIPFQLKGIWERQQRPSVIYDIYDKFSECFSYDKSKCGHLPYTRFHYADIRQHMKHSSTLFNLLDIILSVRSKKIDIDIRPFYYMLNAISNLFYNDPWLHFNIYIVDDDGKLTLSDIIKNSLWDFPVYIHINDDELSKTTHHHLCVYIPKNFQFDHIFSQLSSELFQTFKRESNIHKIRHSLLEVDALIRNKLYDYAKTRYKKNLSLILTFFDSDYNKYVMRQIKHAINKYPNQKIPLSKVDLSNLDKYEAPKITILERLTAINSFFMDIYLLSRYFRSWKWNNPALAVMYVGSNHAMQCAEFLIDYMELDPIEKDDKTDIMQTQCLIINNHKNIFIDNLF
jgi:hypothetical protein